MDTDINHIIHMSLKGDKKYQEILLEKLKPLIFKNIYTYWSPTDRITEDLEQEGYLLILESLNAFDENRNVHFLYYIKTRIIYFYKNYYRNTKKDNKIISLQEDLNLNTDATFNNIFQIELLNELSTCIKTLSIKEQETLDLYYNKQMTMKEISHNLNTPYRTCIGRKNTAIKKLKKLMDLRG